MIKPTCPRCNLSLKTKTAKNVLLYQCPNCFGESYTAGALKRLVEPKVIRILFGQATPDKQNEYTDCPVCHNHMMTIANTEVNDPELDLCHRCQLVWFDQGELQEVKLNHRPDDLAKKSISPEASAAVKEFERKSAIDQKRAKQIQSIGKALNARIRINALDSNSTHIPENIHKVLLAILGMPIEKDQDFFRVKPILTWGLILIATFISLLAFKDELLLKQLSFDPTTSVWGQLRGSLTYFFVHANYFHLIGNLYFLWIFGDNVEDDLGKSNYLMLLGIGTFVSAWCYGLIMDGEQILIGASGGIASVIAYYMVRFPYRKFIVFYFFSWIPLPAWLLVSFFLLKDFLGVFSQVSHSTNVSHISHLGGAAVGLIAGFWMRKKMLS